MPTAAAAAQTEGEALQALAREFNPALIRYFSRRIGASEEIRDLVQDVFVRLLRRHGLVGMDGVRGYVFETAQSVLVDWLRKRQTHLADAHDSFDCQLHGGTDFGPDHILSKREELDRLARLLMELPERTRTIFVLRRIEGMKYKDIAVRLDISVSAVEKHVARTMIHLMDRYRED